MLVEEGLTYKSAILSVYKHSIEVEGVPIVIYDTHGLGDTRDYCDNAHLQMMKEILKTGDIHVVIYCMKLSETRMRDSLIHTFQEYNKIGVNWEHTVIALTFADFIPVPRKEKKKPDFEMGRFFNDRVSERHANITRTLIERVGVMPEVATNIKCYPTTDNPDEILPNGEKWYASFWLEIMDLISPGAVSKFLETKIMSKASGSPVKVTRDNTGLFDLS